MKATPENSVGMHNRFTGHASRKKTRILSVVGLIMCGGVIALELTGLLHSNDTKIWSDFIIFGLCVFLWLKPDNIFIFSLIFIIAAYINLIYGGNILGLLFYTMAMGIGLKMGLFRKGKKFKIPVMLILFFFPVFLQLRFMTRKAFIISIVNILLAMALIWGFLYLFHDNLKGFYTAKTTLDLRGYRFSDRQIACIRGCLERKKLKEIADEQIISESAIKREMLEIYKAFNVNDRHELYLLLVDRTVVFP